jgi:hypothetical protein
VGLQGLKDLSVNREAFSLRVIATKSLTFCCNPLTFERETATIRRIDTLLQSFGSAIAIVRVEAIARAVRTHNPNIVIAWLPALMVPYPYVRRSSLPPRSW